MCRLAYQVVPVGHKEDEDFQRSMEVKGDNFPVMLKVRDECVFIVGLKSIEIVLLRLNKMLMEMQSIKCNLKGKTPTELVAKKEDHNEVGGYFIINGKERLIRLQSVQKRNYVRLTANRKGKLIWKCRLWHYKRTFLVFLQNIQIWPQLLEV